MSGFAPPARGAPAFAGVRAGPGQRYAVEWCKRRLRTIYREARAAGQPSPLNETAAHLYLLISTFVMDRRFISEPMLLQELTAIMHCDAKSVTRARKRLSGLGELELIDGGQGKADVRFALVKMPGPLYAEQGGKPTVGPLVTSDTQSEVTSDTQSEVLPSQSPKLRRTSDTESEVRAADISVLEEVQVRTSSESADVADANRWVTWWTANFPAHNNGLVSTIRQCDRDSALTLVETRRPVRGDQTLEWLQAMAIAYWQVEWDGSDPNRSYIAKSDRSITVLAVKADFVEREVLRLGLFEPREDPAEQLHREIIGRWIAYCHRGSSVARWLVPFRFLDVDGVLNVWSPTREDRERLTRFGFEEPLDLAVADVLGPRRIEFTWGAESDEEATG